MKEWANVVSKRRAVRKYNETLFLSAEELVGVEKAIHTLVPLYEEIRTDVTLVKRDATNVKHGEYCLLFYSENKAGHLLNAGYMMQQMDLYFASRDIGACWYGLAKPKENTGNGLEYVVMLGFGKCKPADFRTSPRQFRRRDVDDIWSGGFDADVKQMVRLAPSACNSQPWRFVSGDGKITVYRSTRSKLLFPVPNRPVLNTIDMGISLLFLEIALEEKNMGFKRTLLEGTQVKDGLMGIAEYHVQP